ncbi:MAG: PASTA domain-containing protein, partial [Crocinitomicaceae bacterium]
GKNLQSASFKIAGKTGTSRLDQGGDPTGDGIKHQASFVGYFPADDPIYSCIVVIAAPTKSIYGSKVSGTVFTAIANKVYSSHLKYHKSIEEEAGDKKETPISQGGSKSDIEIILPFLNIKWTANASGEWVSTAAQGDQILLNSRKVIKNSIPNFKGMGLKDALFILGNMGVFVDVSGAGVIVSQSIPEGAEAIRGSHIKLILE